MRALTNEEVIELQGETAMLMYNEIQQLRKEIRHIRSSDRSLALSPPPLSLSHTHTCPSLLYIRSSDRPSTLTGIT